MSIYRGGEVERAREKRTKSTPVSKVMLWKTSEIVQQKNVSANANVSEEKARS